MKKLEEKHQDEVLRLALYGKRLVRKVPQEFTGWRRHVYEACIEYAKRGIEPAAVKP